MIIAPRMLLVVLVAIAGVSACGDRSDGGQRIEWQGLAIEFKPICKDQEIWLSGSIRNTSSETKRIENGVLPWDYDPVGTFFSAESSENKLTRNPASPMIGRPGPIDLRPQEQRSGETPIGFMFPQIVALLDKSKPVSVHWVYWTSPRPNEAVSTKGTIVISRNPCS